MTTSTTPLPVVAANEDLTSELRATALTDLAANAEWMTYGDVTVELARLAHWTLTPERRIALFDAFKEHIERVAALRAGVADWTEFFDDGDFAPSAGDVQDTAAELLADRAAELLFALTYGEGEK